jgi:uncharacterized membrane protein YccC
LKSAARGSRDRNFLLRRVNATVTTSPLSFVFRGVPAWMVNGVTVTLGLALVQCSISLVAGAHAAQVAVSTAVCASLADVVATTGRVGRRVLVAIIASIASAALYLALRPYGAFEIPVVALIVFGAMLLLSWGPKAGSVSFAAILSLVFAMSLPESQALTWDFVAWGLIGPAGYWIWAVATARLLQPTWRNFALASTAEGMAGLSAGIARQIRHAANPAWQSKILDEESALAERFQIARDLIFGSDEGPEVQREIAILLRLIDLRDLAMACNAEAGRSPATREVHHPAETLGRILERMSDALHAVAEHLRTGKVAVVDPRAEQSIQILLAELEQKAVSSDRSTAKPGVSSLLRSKLGLLHEIQELLDPGRDVDLPCESSDLRRYITPDEWRLASVASNLRPQAPVFRHAVRTCITATTAYAVARIASFPLHPQWIILTIAAVMQGNLAQTLLRRNARVLGTLAGCFVVALLTTSSSTLFLSACFLLAAGIAHAFFGIRYSVTAGGAAIMAVLQAHLAAPDSGFSEFERFFDTVAGALMGWAATYLLPTWQRTTLPTVLRRAIEALRAYAAEATTLRDDAIGSPRFARQRAYDAIRALSAIRSLSLAEPSDVRVPLPQLTSWLSAVYGVMSHLSNIRLSLVLHAREHNAQVLGAAMAAASLAIDTALGADSTVPQPLPALGSENELALAAIPHLASRVHHALEDASSVSALSAQIEALIRSLSAHSGPNQGDIHGNSQ